MPPFSGWARGSKAHLQIAKPRRFFFPLFFVSFCFHNKPGIQPVIAAEGSLSREEGRKIPCRQVSCVCRGCCGEPDGCRGPQGCSSALPRCLSLCTGPFQPSPHQVSLALPLPSLLCPTYQQRCRQAWNLTTKEEFICQHSWKKLFHSLPPSLLPSHVHAHPDTRGRTGCWRKTGFD